jgi:hypothetical protein
VIEDQIERAAQRATLTYRFFPRFTAGVEYNPRSDQKSVLVNFVPLTETNRRPALMLGTSSDRIGSPEGQSYYATLAKDLEGLTGWPVAPYAGVAYGTYRNDTKMIGGLHVRLAGGFSSTLIHDGRELHPTVGYHYKRHSFSVMWVATEELGAAYNVAF